MEENLGTVNLDQSLLRVSILVEDQRNQLDTLEQV